MKKLWLWFSFCLIIMAFVGRKSPFSSTKFKKVFFFGIHLVYVLFTMQCLKYNFLTAIVFSNIFDHKLATTWVVVPGFPGMALTQLLVSISSFYVCVIISVIWSSLILVWSENNRYFNFSERVYLFIHSYLDPFNIIPFRRNILLTSFFGILETLLNRCVNWCVIMVCFPKILYVSNKFLMKETLNKIFSFDRTWHGFF